MTVRMKMVMLASLMLAGVSVPTGRPVREARAAFVGAAGSIDELVDRFLDALEHRDRTALERLRLTEEEYRSVLLPGNHAPGSPPRTPSLRESAFAWGLLDDRSRYAEIALLDRFGGHRLRVTRRAFEKGTREYAGFTAHEKLHLTLEDDTGRVADLHTGSIAQLGGAYKFVSYIRD